jgi:hypothetical protein
MTVIFLLTDIVAAPAKYPHIVKMYADRLAAGVVLSPVLVSRNSRGLLTLVEGHHRFAAHRLAGRVSIEAFVMSVC